VPEAGIKSGTTIVKSAPPKETARITVKPNLPSAGVRPVGNIPTAKPAAGAVPAAVASAVGTTAVIAAAASKPSGATKPATTIVKSAATTKVAPATVKSTASPDAVAVPVPQYQEEGSTMLTTAFAALLALFTWGTAIALALNWAGIF